MEAKLTKITGKGYKPSVSFTEKELPQVVDWQPGKKYHLILEVEMTGVAKQPDYSSMPLGTAKQEPPKIFRGSFDILAVGADEDYHTEYARRMAGRKS